MKFILEIEDNDIIDIKKFYQNYFNDPFVKRRIEKNIDKKINLKIDNETIWKSIITCLLTTQQRSGPNSIVSKFLRQLPFPLSYDKCKTFKNENEFLKIFKSNGKGLRRTNNISSELITILIFLENDSGWQKLIDILKNISNKDSERTASKFIFSHFKGFGPKQSRNLLQDLGLSKYEIPLDSRIIQWLKKLNFPIPLSSNALSDPNYYEFILDCFQYICLKCDIYPCVLDAVIFTSYDKGGWTDENLF